MRVVGFDADVAAAHGYSIITRDGVQESVSTTDVAKPANTVGGDCGNAYLTLTASHLEYHVSTGYHLFLPSVYHAWYVDVFGPYSYERDLQWTGINPLDLSWSASASIPVDDTGYYAGAVVFGLSYATLADGSECDAEPGIESTTMVN